MTGLYRLKGSVKHYDWGGWDYIPSLLDIDNKEKKPYAEYWMGIHQLGSANIELEDGGCRPLKEYTNDLPYLLKILDVRDMLSIQVHPSKEAAEKEFERENAEGIPADAPTRNYRDANHKPEFMAALSDFWLLHGFKPEEELIDILTGVKELNSLLTHYNMSGYAALYRHVMEMPQEEVNRILQPLLDLIVPLYHSDKLKKAEEHFWAARAALTFSKGGDIDRGIFSVYLFNLVHLKKGEGIFQDAGVPHAYLEGQNVEIMANSDNVLRGGLTTKHIDVNELMKHVKCEATWPEILIPRGHNAEKEYKTPAPDFRLSVFELKKGQDASFTSTSTDILIVTNGIIEAISDSSIIKLQHGDPSAVVFPGKTVHLKAITDATVYRSTVPVNIR